MSMTHIETIELGSSQASITFSSIPQSFDDLMLKASVREGSTSSATIDITFNGTSSNRSAIIITGDGSSVSSGSRTTIQPVIPPSDSTSDTFGSFDVYISNYTASQAKSVSIDSVSENNGTTAYQRLVAGLWNDTSAITSITLTEEMVAGTTVSLYGVTAGGSGTVTTA